MKYAARLAAGLLCAAAAAVVLQLFPDEARTRETVHRAGAMGFDRSHGTLAGPARVIDGDTLEIAGTRIRLEGIDAPEIKQVCRRKGVGSWPAGRIAAGTLERWIAGRTVTCRAIGRDGYRRVLARCSVAGIDLNAGMVRHGLAWAFVKYSQNFVAEERAARHSAAGLWAAQCETAWNYRANRWNAVADAAPNGCAIKGNITRNGRIYHMPWNQWYSRTRIEPEKGERWFCDEGQALAAGWRPAMVR